MLHEQKETYNSLRFLSQAETGGAVYKLQIKAVFVKNHLHSIDPNHATQQLKGPGI